MLTNSSAPPSAAKTISACHVCAPAAPKYETSDVRRGAPSKPAQCIESDISVMPANQSHTCARAIFGAKSLRPVSAGTRRYAEATNVSATGPPTVM